MNPPTAANLFVGYLLAYIMLWAFITVIYAVDRPQDSNGQVIFKAWAMTSVLAVFTVMLCIMMQLWGMPVRP